MNKITIHQGHVLEVLKGMPAESVQCVVTSPPYWGLRDYGIEPQVWMRPDTDCPGHEWGPVLAAPINQGGVNSGLKDFPGGIAHQSRPDTKSNFCRLCGAFRGSLGLEPTIELYVAHIVEIFREVWRVLRPDGVLFLNLGDSYCGSGGAGGDYNPGGLRAVQPRYQGTGRQAGKGPRGGSPKHADPYACPGEGPNRLPVPGLKAKDLCGIPWRVALALQADGWWLRSDIIWSKPNPMPESRTDRPTRAHEYIFLLTKSAKYFWDAEAVREPHNDKAGPPSRFGKNLKYQNSLKDDGISRTRVKTTIPPHEGYNPSGRNLRSVWEMATAPFPDAHFATFPPELVRRCVAAGTSERGCCPKCGAGWKRVMEKTGHINKREPAHQPNNTPTKTDSTGWAPTMRATDKWLPTCACQAGKPLLVDAAISGAELFDKMEESWLAKKPHAPTPCTVLDPFAGAGTAGLVAAKMGRDAVLIELKPEYCRMAEQRIRKNLGMLAEVVYEN